MRILLTNDDGIRAPGIAALHQEIRHLGEVLAVAPLHAQSASSHGVTYEQPVFSYEVTVSETLTGYGVEGLPADCVKIGLSQIWPAHYDSPPDIVISGMNAGANAGISTIYSGTVAAAREGTFQGIPSIAVSLLLQNWDQTRFDVAARHARQVLEQILGAGPLDPAETLNINLPATEEEQEMPAVRVAPMNLGPYNEGFERRHSPRGNPYFWAVGNGLDFRDTAPDSDVDVILRGEIAVTPLQFDLTQHSALDRWGGRLKE